MQSNLSNKVAATQAALELINKLVEKHGELMFHQSGGCCDGSSPMCYARGELQLGERDRCLGEIGGQPFYIDRQQYRAWGEAELLIDVVAGRGGMFSLEGSEGVRFHTRSMNATPAGASDT
ncbi:MAG: DUF779 domain-containing protein [Immundisolibacteraceae bacterium]|nr:DUF779 domain-containing protein [Immundisolibacteraceae bacterium]